MIKNIFVPAAFILVFIGAGFALPATASAIDSGAKKNFEGSVKEVGGSEATDFTTLVKDAINLLLFVTGVVAVVIIVIGSLRFVTSEGDSQSANKAKNTVVFAVIGLVLAILAYAIVNFVVDALK